MRGLMHRSTWVLLPATVLLWSIAAPASIGPPPSEIFRLSVASSDMIVLGSIVDTEPVDPETPSLRFSTLMVEHVLHGGVAAEDSVRVRWTPRRWTSSDGETVCITTGAGPNLDRFTGVSALYLLSWLGEFAKLHTGKPIVLSHSPASHREIREMIGWIRSPEPGDMYADALQDSATLHRWCGEVDPAELDRRLDVFATYLEDFLRGAEATPEGAR